MQTTYEGKKSTMLYPNDFGTLFTSLLSCITENISQCVKDSVKIGLDEYQQSLKHPKEEEIEDGYMTRSEAMKFLRTSAPTLHRYTKSGLLSCSKLGRKVYYKKSDLINATKVVQKKKGTIR